ncbi:C4-dicarboxylate transport sensor protein DctB [Pseudoalteromonas sp. P1-9]|nr:C4-dicarboxylate transport sensor protein DctB [Pseudoalteromonas sp. P1-9]
MKKMVITRLQRASKQDLFAHIAGVTLLLLSLLPTLLSAAPKHAAVFDDIAQVMQQYDFDNGLSQASVTAITQDKFGYIWLGTQSGLNRFDGKRFKHFFPAQPLSNKLAGGFITSLCSQTNYLWIGTQTGLSRYHLETSEFERISINKEGESVERIKSLSCNDDSLVITSDDGELYVYQTEKGLLSGKDIFDESNVRAIHLAQSQWFAVTDEGIVTKQIGAAKSELLLPGKIEQIAVKNNALVLLDNALQVCFYQLAPLQNMWCKPLPISHMAEVFQFSLLDHDLLIASSQGAFQLSHSGEILHHFKRQAGNQKGLAENTILAIFKSQEGDIWLGTETQGLYHYRELSNAFGHIYNFKDTARSSDFYDVRSFEFDASGTLWIGTSKGIYLYSNQRFFAAESIYPSLKTFNNTFITDLTIFNDNVWITSRGAGLAKFDLTTGKTWLVKPKINNQEVESFNSVISYKGELVFSSRSQGLLTFNTNTKQFSHFIKNNENAPEHATGLYTDGEHLWFGSIGMGLFKYDGETLVSINQEQGLSSDLVFMIEKDAQNRIWAATDKGLSIVNQDMTLARIVERKHGLANNAIWALVKDNNGNFWAGTSGGLSHIQSDDFTIRNYLRNDGIQSNEFNFNAALKTQEGRLFLGGSNGFNQFYPYAIERARKKPNVQLSAIKVLEKELTPINAKELSTVPELTQSLTLKAKQNILSLAYSSTSLASDRLSHLYYRVIGLSDKWIKLEQGRNQIDLINLTPGDYIIEAYLVDRFNNASAAHQLKLTIVPPWWASNVTKVSYLLFALLIGSLIVYSRVKRYRQVLSDNNKMKQLNERFEISLWASGDDLWDWHIANNTIHRFSVSSQLDFGELTDAVLLDELHRYVHPKDCILLEDKLERCISGEIDSYEIAIRVKEKSGKFRWVRDRGKVVSRSSTGVAERIVGGIQDIQKLKENELALEKLNHSLEEKVQERTLQLEQNNQQLLQTLDELEKMQQDLIESEKMASLGNLVAGVAHEINTPLGIAITGVSSNQESIGLIESQLANKTLTQATLINGIAKQREVYQLVQRNLERAEALIANFKQVAVDQSSEQMREVHVREYLEQLRTSLAPLTKGKDITVSIACPESLVVETYPGAWYQVMSNLIQNSVTHGFEGLNKGNIAISITLNNGKLVVLYQDDGKGVSEEVRERMFEPFVTTKRNQGGSGLGMHIVYNLVTQLLNGEITSRRVENQGAVFEIECFVNVINE